MDQSLQSGLLEAIMELEGSLVYNLGWVCVSVVLVQNHKLHDISLSKSS